MSSPGRNSEWDDVWLWVSLSIILAMIVYVVM
jgi:hypothetical protein